MSLYYHHPSIWHSCNFETGGMFNDTNGIPDRRFSIVEYHRSFVEYQHEIASSLEDADSFFPIPSISIDGDDRGKKRATQREDDELSISNHSKIAKLRGITFHASLFRFISKRNASPPRLLVSRVHAASTIFSSILRQKPEEKASGCTAAKWKDNFAEPGQTFDGFEHPAPRFPFPRFITSNFVSSFVSHACIPPSILSLSLHSPFFISFLQMTVFSNSGPAPGKDPAKGFARGRVPLPNIHRDRGK